MEYCFILLCIVVLGGSVSKAATSVYRGQMCHLQPIKFPAITNAFVANFDDRFGRYRVYFGEDGDMIEDDTAAEVPPRAVFDGETFHVAAKVTIQFPLGMNYRVNNVIWSILDPEATSHPKRIHVTSSSSFPDYKTSFRSPATYPTEYEYSFLTRRRLRGAPILTIVLDLWCSSATLKLDLRSGPWGDSSRMETFSFDEIPLNLNVSSDQWQDVEFKFTGPEHAHLDLHQVLVRNTSGLIATPYDEENLLFKGRDIFFNDRWQNGRLNMSYMIKVPEATDDVIYKVALSKENFHPMIRIAEAKMFLNFTSTRIREPLLLVRNCFGTEQTIDRINSSTRRMSVLNGRYPCFKIDVEGNPAPVNRAFVKSREGDWYDPAWPVLSSSHYAFYQSHTFQATSRIGVGEKIRYKFELTSAATQFGLKTIYLELVGVSEYDHLHE